MADSIIQSFLDNRFIKTDDPEHIVNLGKASADVQKLLSKRKQKIIGYTLVALDPTISDDDPIIGEVEGLIIKHWSAFRNSVVKTTETPIAYVQAVILEALYKLSKEENFAAIIWHTGCNIISHYKLAGQEKILTHFLFDIGNRVEESGRKIWCIDENVKIDAVSSIEFTFPKNSQVKVDAAKLQGHLKAASIHTSWGEGGESQFTTSQNNVNWAKFFSERAGDGIAKEINAAFATQNQSLMTITDANQETMSSYFTNLIPYLEQATSSIIQRSQSLKKRNNLLWWKQALYSSRLDTSYRSLTPLALAIAMAVDLADSIEPIYPKSVDYFLKEALRDVLGEKTDKEESITELLVQLQTLSNAENQLLVDLCHESESRKQFGTCIADMMRKLINIEELIKHSGLEKSAQISLGNLSTWIFHDLQANKLVNAK